MNTFREIDKKIKEANKILLTTHIGPDGDSISSCLSFGMYLQSIHKNFDIVSYHPTPSYLERVLDTSLIIKEFDCAKQDLSEYDLLVGLDMNKESYCTEDETFRYPKNIEKINIDHHQNNMIWGDLNYTDFDSSSTCSIVYNFFTDLSIDITPDIAGILAIGLLTDTGYLKNSNAHAEDFRIMANLIDKGFDLRLNEILQQESLNEFLYKGIVFSNIVVSLDNKYAYSTCTNQEKQHAGIDTNEQLPRAANHLKKINGVDFIFFVKEKLDNGEIFYSVSFRSVNLDVNVADYASKLGGGGHIHAAGAAIKDVTSMEDALTKVIEVIK